MVAVFLNPPSLPSFSSQQHEPCEYDSIPPDEGGEYGVIVEKGGGGERRREQEDDEDNADHQVSGRQCV